MKTLNKIILSGLSALLMSCSNESTSPDITGATTEPNSSKTANLTEEQKAVLARSLYTLVDSTKVDSLKALFGSDITKMDSRYIEYFDMRPYSVMNDQVFSYPSKDGRKVCDVVTYKQENGKNQKFKRLPENPVDHPDRIDSHFHSCLYGQTQQRRI